MPRPRRLLRPCGSCESREARAGKTTCERCAQWRRGYNARRYAERPVSLAWQRLLQVRAVLDAAILDLMQLIGEVYTGDVVAVTGCSESTAQSRLRVLQRRGVLESRVAHRPGAPPRRMFGPVAARAEVAS